MPKVLHFLLTPRMLFNLRVLLSGADASGPDQCNWASLLPPVSGGSSEPGGQPARAAKGEGRAGALRSVLTAGLLSGRRIITPILLPQGLALEGQKVPDYFALNGSATSTCAREQRR